MPDTISQTSTSHSGSAPDVATRFAQLAHVEPLDDYNFRHVRTKHLAADGRRTAEGSGIMPGTLAPDFELPQVGGGTLRLSDLRGRPVLLHFGSFT